MALLRRFIIGFASLGSFGMLMAAGTGLAAEASGSVIAQADQHPVTTLDLDARMRGAPRGAAIGALNNHLMMKKMAESLFAQKAIADEARKMGLDKDPVLQAKARQLVDGLLFKERMRLLSEEPVPDMSEAAREKYDANPDAWAEPERIAVAHILIRTTFRGKRFRSDEEALKLANELRDKLKKGANFAELAQRYSNDTSTAPRGGVLGIYKHGQLGGGAFEKAAFALTEKNDISEPVKSPFGYHIIKLYRRIPKKAHSFDEVKNRLIKQLEAAYRAERREEYLAKVQQREHFRVNDSQLRAFVARKKKELHAGKVVEEEQEMPHSDTYQPAIPTK